MLNPLPDREEFERAIRDLLNNGDIEDTARYLQMGRTNLSKMLNPDVPERHNPFWLATACLWAFDAKRDGLADDVLSIISCRRSLWLPAPAAAIDEADAIKNIGDQLMDLVENKMKDAADEVLVKEANDIRRAVNDFVNGVLSRRGRRLTAE